MSPRPQNKTQILQTRTDSGHELRVVWMSGKLLHFPSQKTTSLSNDHAVQPSLATTSWCGQGRSLSANARLWNWDVFHVSTSPYTARHHPAADVRLSLTTPLQFRSSPTKYLERSKLSPLRERMHLIATGRAVRQANASRRHAHSWPSSSNFVAAGSRSSSSNGPLLVNAKLRTSCTPSSKRLIHTSNAHYGAVPASSSAAAKPITVGGREYPSDSWTNIPPSILSLINRQLHMQPDHPVSIIRQIIESQFGQPVYENHSNSSPVVTTSQNFDVLGFPADHPGRSRTDTYYVNQDTVLRTHTSAHQAELFRALANRRAAETTSGYTLAADVYRRDAIDRSHYPVFHQMEGARLWNRKTVPNGDIASAVWQDLEKLPKHNVKVEDPNPTTHPERNPLQGQYHAAKEVDAIAAHLKRSLESVVVGIFSSVRQAAIAAGDTNVDAQEPLRVRWIEAFFPFTSPSWELEVFWQGEWLELLGCGVVKQQLLNDSDASDQVGWAFGVGLERVAMLLFSIPDIRLFWSQDERFSSQFSKGKVTRFAPFSKYPSCYKDVSFWLPRSAFSSAGGAVKSQANGPDFHENDLMELVRDIGGDLVEDVKLIDEFTHPKKGDQSRAYRINYRSLERTLTNEEANQMHEAIKDKLVQSLKVMIR